MYEVTWLDSNGGSHDISDNVSLYTSLVDARGESLCTVKTRTIINELSISGQGNTLISPRRDSILMLNLRWLLIFDGITIRLSLDAMP